MDRSHGYGKPTPIEQIEHLRQRVAELERQLTEVRKQERERIIAIAEEQGWAMRNEDPFEDAVREVCAIRAME